MRLVPEPEVWRASLVAWTLRGVFCALPSFIWAVNAGFSKPTQLAEMFMGVATYVVVFAWVTALPKYREHAYGSDLGWSLRVAANTRAALAPLMFYGPDMFLGMVAMHVVKGTVRVLGMRIAEGAIGWTYVTTLVQGALVSVTMVLLALLICGGRVALRKSGAEARPTSQGTS